MRRLFLTIVFLLFQTGAIKLWPQELSDFIFVARRSGIAEVLNATTLTTVARIHFDFHVERLSASADGSKLRVEGYASGFPCCKHYVFDPETSKLEEDRHSTDGHDGGFGDCLVSPDGRWCFRLKNFREPVLKTIDLYGSESPREMIPPNLPAENNSGNWYLQGVWSGNRFYLYVCRPDDPGLLWIVLPGAEALGVGTPVASFNEDARCGLRLPAGKHLVASGTDLFLFESFGNRNKSSRLCHGLPGGAQILDPANGHLAGQVAPKFHFSSLISDPSQSALYGVALGGGDSLGEPEQVVRLDARDGKVTNSRTLGAGESLSIAVGRLSVPLTSDLTALWSNDR